MKKLNLLLVCALLLAALAGCTTPAAEPAPAAEEPAAGEAAAPAEQASTEAAVTLRVLDSFTSETADPGMEKLNQMFMEKYPNITIERESMVPEDMRTVVQTTLAAETAPDVLYYDTGPGFAGVLASAGLIRPIDDLYEQYGWNDRIFEWTKARTTFDGQTYGIGNELEFYGGYYNINLFEELGLEPPQTYDDLLGICQTARDNGLVAIAFADQGKWPAYHTFSITANNMLGKEKMDAALFGDGRWDDPDVVRAIDVWFREMNEAGCFVDDPAAVNYDDGSMLFYTGQALMHFTGTWLLSAVLENVADFEVGWTFFPSIDGRPVLPPAGLGSGYFISSASQNVDAAGKYLDFLFSEEAAQVWMEDMNYILPMDVDSSAYDIPELLQFAVEALATQEMGHNIDVLTPDNFNTAMGDGFQAVLLGEKTPEQQAADLQAAWEQAIAEGRVIR